MADRHQSGKRQTTGPTQTERVVAFLRAHPGVTTMELQLGLAPFVSNPRARISDARAAGIDVQPRKRADGRTGFVVVERELVAAGQLRAFDE